MRPTLSCATALIAAILLSACERTVVTPTAAQPAEPAVPTTPAAPASPPPRAYAEPLLEAPSTGGDREVMTIRTRSGTLDCAGKDVQVIADGATLVLTGACGEIYVVGKDDTLAIDSARVVQVSGGKGVAVTAHGTVDQVYLIGDDGKHAFASVGALNVNSNRNVVSAQSIDTLSLVGDDNRIEWRAGEPDLNDIGSRNQLTQAK